MINLPVLRMKMVPILLMGLLMMGRGYASDPQGFEVRVVGEGPPVLLIPGLSCGGEIWDETLEAISANYECHVLSLSGFAGIPPVEHELSLAQIRDEIIAYIQNKELLHPVIIGHSLGGMLALAVAEEAPELAAGLIIVDALPASPLLFMIGDDGSFAPGAWITAIQSVGQERFVTFQSWVLATMVKSPEDLVWIRKHCEKSDPATVARLLAELLQMDLRPKLREIQCPVLVLAGMADKTKILPREEIVRQLKDLYTPVRSLQIEFYDDACHFVMFDETARFQKDVLAALARMQPGVPETTQ